MPAVNDIARLPQRKILLYLRAHVAGQRLIEAPFAPLPDDIRAPKAIRALILKDFITLSTLRGTPEYKITGRGLKALEQIETIWANRRVQTGVCKVEGCGNPSYVSPAGLRRAYCKTCLAARERERYQQKGHTYDPQKPCPRCGAQRHVSSTGVVRPYCHACLLENNRACAHTHRHSLTQRLAQGECITCRTKGCDKSVARTRSGRVTPLCQECLSRRYRQQRQAVLMNRQRRKIAAFFKK